MVNENESEKVKIVDRRRFTESGEAKDSAHIEPQPNTQASPNTAEQQHADGPRGEESSVDFAGFIISLATQTLVMLGEVPHPETNVISPNIDGARQIIDILALLQEKTRGNLNPSEDRLLNDALLNLRMAFVNKMKSGSKSAS